MNPFGSITILLGTILVFLFFANSQTKRIKIFSFIFSMLAFVSSFVINIIGFLNNGVYSDNLFTSGLVQIIEISYILIISIILLIIIFVFNGESEFYLKLNIIFLFSSASLIFFTISRNFIVFFASLVFFLISLFALATLMNESGLFALKSQNDSRKSAIANIYNISANNIVRFFLAVVFSLLFIFFAISLLYGVFDFKNFIQLAEGIGTYKDNLGFVFSILALALYLYYGFFPFQSPYIRVTTGSSGVFSYLMWLFYFLPGLIFTSRFALIIYNVKEDYKTILVFSLALITIVSAIGSGLAVLKSKNLRKILSNLILLIFTGNILNLLLYIVDYVNEDGYRMLNYSGLSLMIISWLPLAVIFTLIENNTGSNDINGLRSILIKNKAVSAGFIISCISLIGIPAFAGFTHKNYYMSIIPKAFAGGLSNLTPLLSWTVIVSVAIYLGFFIAGIIRIIISGFTGKVDIYNDKAIFSKPALAFIYCFIFLIFVFGILYLIGLFGINLFGLNFSSLNLF
jgi:NADH:ubiquinone oxidoreductase subunit 2 (subunit N)